MMEEIKKSFIKASIKDLEQIECSLDFCDGVNVDQHLIEKVFTTTHNIKGTAPMFGIDNLDHIVKPMELVYGELRNGKLVYSEDIVINTKTLIPVIKSELCTNQQHTIDSKDVNQSLRFFDSLIAKNA